MALTPGTRLGVYEVTAQVGEGGMGQVYRATDTKLKRQVAIKILPPSLAADADRLARFQREAEVLASLNHPQIAAIYGLEDADDTKALVMELVEGEDLSQRIARGPIPLDDALPIARQIAEALESAHEQGIIHRDLKPANIKLRPDGVVKVLDFGLAKLAEPPSASGAVGLSQSPTITTPAMMTGVGMMLGTAAYMSPEQARGKTVDKRADIWAFGLVLHEMLTGTRLFQGEDVSLTLAAIVMQAPDLSAAPARVRPLLKRCLEKDPKKRLRDIGEAWFLLEDRPTEGMVLPAPSRSRLGIVASIAAAVFAAAAAGAAFVHFRQTPPAAEPVRFQIRPPEKGTFSNGLSSSLGLALSPDGRRLAFTARSEGGVDQLWVRALENLQAWPLPGTEGATQPFWSPDSRFIAFQVQEKLKKVEASGGPPQTLCNIGLGIGYAGAWSPHGMIIVPRNGGLMRCAADGTASPVITSAPSRGDFTYSPSFLPDGRHFVYQRFSRTLSNIGMYVGSVDAKPEQQDSKRLMAIAYDSGALLVNVVHTPAPILGASMGYLLFGREGSIMAQAFDSRRLELVGESTPIVGGPLNAAVSAFSASTNGVLAYQAGGARREFQATWLDREGKVAGTAANTPNYSTSWNFSPDGTRAAGVVLPGQIWLYDFARGNRTRFTLDANANETPVWSPDGSQIIFTSLRDGVWNLIQKDSNGAGTEDVIFKSSEHLWLYDWSRNGFLLYGVIVGLKDSLWSLSLSDRKSTLYLKRDALLHSARFSPDGHCVAYASDESGKQASDESGKQEVYVQPFPASAESKWQVSKGGSQPRWRRDGKELFYTSTDSKMMAVDVTTAAGKCGPASPAGLPKALFTTPGFGTLIRSHQYDVSANGKRFLIRDLPSETAGADALPITVVLDWQAALNK